MRKKNMEVEVGEQGLLVSGEITSKVLGSKKNDISREELSEKETRDRTQRLSWGYISRRDKNPVS